MRTDVRSQSEPHRKTGCDEDVPTPWASLRPGAFSDISLNDISLERVSSLCQAEEAWLGSFGFCTAYAFPPASDIWISVDDQGRVSKCCYYVEQRWLGALKKLHIFGPTNLTEYEVQLLLAEKQAALACITCMGPNDVSKWSGSWYRFASTAVNEDFILELPRSEEAYLRSLGSNARTQLPYYLRRVRKEWGDDCEVSVTDGLDISKDIIAELVELNRTRIERKGVAHLWHPQLLDQRWRLAQDCGLFCGIRHEGNLVAGTLSYLHRGEAYFVLIGHRAEYDRLRLGKLVLWLTIQQLIQRGFTRYHLLWGKSSYKVELGGRPRILSEITVFRRPWVALLWHLREIFEKTGHIGRRIARIPIEVTRRICASISCSPAADKGL
jgi:hypothetical protein